MTETPRIEVDDDGEFILLQSIRSILRIVGFLLFCSIVIMAGLGWNQTRLNTKLNNLGNATEQIDTAAQEARDAAAAAKQQVEDAVNQINEGRPERNVELQQVYEAIFQMQEILQREFG